MRTIKKYALYILLGLLYPLVKVIWYINGLVYLRGVVYGLIAGVITISIGIRAQGIRRCGEVSMALAGCFGTVNYHFTHSHYYDSSFGA